MADAVVVPAEPMAAAVADAPLFTPAVIDRSKCLARVWGNGAGAQCSMPHQESSEFCALHNKSDRWKVHGKVDGAIPEAKLKEFVKANASTPRVALQKQKTRADAATPPPKKHKAGAEAASPDSAKDTAPKKPVGGGFSVFKAESIEAIKAAKPADANFGYISKEAAVRWKALTEEQQKVFQAKFAEKVAAYEADPHHTKDKKHKRVQERVLTPAGDALKRPQTSFSIFVEANREAIKSKLPAGSHPVTDVTREAGRQWKALSPEEQQVYKAQSEAKKEVYKQAKGVYEQAKKVTEAAQAPTGQKPKHKLRRRKAW